MITVERLTRDDGTSYDEYRGLPADPRPTEGLTVGDIFVEIRTGKRWKWTGSDWDRIEYPDARATTVTIAVADWNSGTTCTKTVSGVTSSSIIIVDPSDASIECTAQATNSLTFTAAATPSNAITVKVVIL